MEGNTRSHHSDRFAELKVHLGNVAAAIRGVVEGQELTHKLAPAFFQEGVMLYPRRAGKALRPALLLCASDILGGNPEGALRVGAAVEMFHIFTLVHDDIIDRDELRRGGPTTHIFFTEKVGQERALPTSEQNHLGASLAILGGDVQHAFAVSLITGAARDGLISAELALYLLDELEVCVLTPLVEGQVLDLMLSTAALDQVTEPAIVDMLWKKTGVLFQYSLKAGALIGLNKVEPNHPQVQLLAAIGRLFGVSFQFMDDLLGLIGEEASFGKPIGSDLYEGKRTALVIYAYNQATSAEKKFIKEFLGNQTMTHEQMLDLKHLLVERGAARYAHEKVDSLLTQCRELIAHLPEHEARGLLDQIADFAASRQK